MVLIARDWALALGVLVALLMPGDGKTTGDPPARPQAPKAEASQEGDEGRLGMSPAVACESVAGYEQYVPLPDATLTKDDKLLVYYRPLRYAVAAVGSKYQAHFVQDVRVRKRGDKTIIWSRDKLFEQKFEGADPPALLCLYNKIALKGLTPGEYDLDIILHDVNSKSPPARQILQFKVKPSASTPAPDAKREGKVSDEPAARRSANENRGIKDISDTANSAWIASARRRLGA